MAYVPERGDLVWVSLDPQSGHEQKGRRPVLVLSPAAYNGVVGLFLICPVTSKSKGYPFEVLLESGGEIEGVVLADQVKSLDWRVRNAAFIERVSDQVVDECVAKASALLEGV
jgi:mRNA interferase MazF